MRSDPPLQDRLPEEETITRQTIGKPLSNSFEPSLLPSSEIGIYKILKHIGRGGSADVYQVQDPMGQILAIKLARPDRIAGQIWRVFATETRWMSYFNQRHLVPYKGSGDFHGRPLVVMPYFPSNLSQRLQEGKLSVDETVKIMLQVCSALVYIHGIGLIHGDVKPSNILIDERGDARLGDFGIVRVIGYVPEETEDESSTWPLAGTMPYMRPEILCGEAPIPNPSWDVYSFGVTFYQMLTGALPPGSFRPGYFRDRPQAEAIPSLRTIDPKIPKTLDQIIQRCCARNGGFKDANQLYLVLKQWRFRWRVRFTVCTMILLVAFGMWGMISTQPKDPLPAKKPEPFALTPEQQKEFAKILSSRYTSTTSGNQKGEVKLKKESP